jgi:hypothetical protein
MGSTIADNDSQCTPRFVTIEMRNRSRIDTPVNLGNHICVGKLREIRGVVDWCTSIPLDTPLARLVTAPPGTEMIKHDLVPLHKSERSNSTSAADAAISA